MVELALYKLQGFLDSNDKNCKSYTVKYLGLVGLEEVISRGVTFRSEYRTFILDGLGGRDTTTRLKALDLLRITVKLK